MRAKIWSVGVTPDKGLAILVAIDVPPGYTPRLANATEEELRDWEYIGPGEGLHWSDLDEDISLHGLLRDALAETP